MDIVLHLDSYPVLVFINLLLFRLMCMSSHGEPRWTRKSCLSSKAIISLCLRLFCFVLAYQDRCMKI